MDSDSQDEIKDYLDARCLSASETAWRIFGFQINHREPSVSPLPIHLLAHDQVIFEEGSEQAALQTTVLMLDRYPSPSQSTDTIFDDIKSCEYYEQYMVSNTLPQAATTAWRDQVPDHQMYVYQKLREEKICQMNILYPSSGEVFYLKLLLLHTTPRSFLLARTVDGTVHESFQAAARALGG